MWFSLVGNKRMWATNYDNTLEFYKNGFVVEDGFEKVYSKGISCRFNPVMLHGVECGDDFSASLRIDGEYTKEFRNIFFFCSWTILILKKNLMEAFILGNVLTPNFAGRGL